MLSGARMAPGVHSGKGEGVARSSGAGWKRAVTAVAAITLAAAAWWFPAADVSAASGGSPAGVVLGWGANEEGQIGDGVSRFQLEPEELPGLGGVAAVGSGQQHDLVALKSGRVLDWGANDYGQLGNGSTQNSDTPVEAAGIDEAVAVTGGFDYSLALLKSGKVMAWGNNATGAARQTGPTTSSRHEPVEVQGTDRSRWPIAARGNTGERYPRTDPYNLALLKSGKVMVWGRQRLRTVSAHGTTARARKCRSKSKGMSEVVGIATGWEHSAWRCMRSGKVMAWGNDALRSVWRREHLRRVRSAERTAVKC